MDGPQYVYTNALNGLDDLSERFLSYEAAVLAARECAQKLDAAYCPLTVLQLLPLAHVQPDGVVPLAPHLPVVDPLDLRAPVRLAPDPARWAEREGRWVPLETSGEAHYTVKLRKLKSMLTGMPRALWPEPYALPFTDQDDDRYDLDATGDLVRYYATGDRADDQAVYAWDVLGLAGALLQRGRL